MSTGFAALPARRGGLGIRGKLAGLLVLPLAAVLVLATVRLIEVGERAGDAGRVTELAALGSDLSELTRLLHEERMTAVGYLAVPATQETGFREAVKAVDTQIQLIRADRSAIEQVPAEVAARLDGVDDSLAGLAAIRAGVGGRADRNVSETAKRYGVVLTGLSGYETVVSRVAEPGVVADSLRALAAFSKIEAAAAEQAVQAYVARLTGDAGADRQRALISAQAIRADALADFRAVADTQQIALVESVLGDEEVVRADTVTARLTGPNTASPEEIAQVFGDVVALLSGAEQQIEAEVAAVAGSASTASSRRTTIEFVVVLLVLLIAVALAFYLARSLHISVRRLREGALTVANRDLPDVVQRLQDAENLGEGGVDRIVEQTRNPIRIVDRDEFGQVAEAFNMVHREAVRVAAEQASLRASLSTMFLSLARRSQTLVDRMIGELDQIERNEEDPKRLARLFELDHLATRMRRNDENLLVLAGAEVGTPRREDALLVDAIRAAQSEVELYHRIEFGSIDTDISVASAAVNDVVRLIAELLDNATRFSPPNTVVMAHGSRSGDRVLVQVEDHGLGISADQLDQINRRLHAPSDVDAGTFRLMGFAVVGRLAARHGIGIDLRPGPEGGTIAEVSLPADIVIMPGLPAPPARPVSWSRPVPAVESRPANRAPRAAEPAYRATRHAPPPAELDLKPTTGRPKLPTRVPQDTGETPGWGASFEAFPAPAEPEPTPAPAPAAATAPIQMEMQQGWFDGETADDGRGMPTAGYAPPPSGVPLPPLPPPPTITVPRPREAVEDRWKTTADDGWQRARAAAEPQHAGTTRTGLPKRVPQAQLVPGGVQSVQRVQQRRSPDDVRGLLSAYHRGVQRGRTDGVAETAAAATWAPKENDQ
ncbi:sensor histidine kinase [Actinoplanes rectilineatus]|uniref:sensor histidine kinase n=1 Tax=Actinoplanes rectilineatus TaxID=113571 RepID=UPI0005F29232|nr:nitrate- and nitrite sensing domain-containing protein [Actinoplanes rectilineatus]